MLVMNDMVFPGFRCASSGLRKLPYLFKEGMALSFDENGLTALTTLAGENA